MSAPYRDPARLIDEMLTRLEQEQRARHEHDLEMLRQWERRARAMFWSGVMVGVSAFAAWSTFSVSLGWRP